MAMVDDRWGRAPETWGFVLCPACGGHLSDDGHSSNLIRQASDGRRGIVHSFVSPHPDNPFLEGSWDGVGTCDRCGRSYRLKDMKLIESAEEHRLVRREFGWKA